ncbi:TrkH family potassium uptake protein [Butyricimonas paravirosa]|uniref:TrkH family potassium uptake protein n=1 Tax=Butyricimonas paravirosa TaxID=1472417 RepID=UPI00210CDE0D|nr:potassium transporter TrkG [Butyricimonas paravirosa]MCQ4872935.1 ATPase [Butyricimonas paravirosa]
MFSVEVRYRLKQIYRTVKQLVEIASNALLFLASFLAVILIIYRFGFEMPEGYHHEVYFTYRVILRLFLMLGILRFLFNFKLLRAEKGFWVEVLVLLVLLGMTLFSSYIDAPDFVAQHPFWHSLERGLTYIIVLLLSVIQLSKQIFVVLRSRVKAEVLFATSFLFIILLGAVLLMLPNATYDGITFVNALFTSTSAVCVTGLTVVDTSATFTPTGLVILLFLIQVGGIGVMTFTSFFAMSFLSGTSFHDQFVMKNLLNEASLSDIFRTVVYIVLTTFIIEGVGVYLVYLQIQDVAGIGNKFFFSLFHGVSAFCNAGFSTLPGNLYDPLIRHVYGLQVILAFLIIFGGIGFPILFNYVRLFHYWIRNNIKCLLGLRYKVEHQPRIVSTTTRVVLPATLVLLIVGTGLFWIFENHNALEGMSVTGKFATAFMGAVTPRTAGFNNVDMSILHTSTIFLTIVLMWIGAAPMSTGGGIKVTTFVIALKNIWALLKGQDRVIIARRQLTRENVNRAHAIIVLSILWTILAVFALILLEPEATITQAVFEITSALGTVGLTLNLTPTLCVASKIIVSLTMFVGRVGLITLLACFIHSQEAKLYTYPDETVIL